MQHGLDLGRINVDATRDHHVALAVTDEHITVGIDVTDIAAGDETIAIDLGALLGLVVIGKVRVGRDARVDFADLTLRQNPSVVADEPQFCAGRDLAHRAGFLQRIF